MPVSPKPAGRESTIDAGLPTTSSSLHFTAAGVNRRLQDPPLSLQQLKVGESFQLVNDRARELVRLTENLPGYDGDTACYRAVPMGDMSNGANLASMNRLSQDINDELDDINSLIMARHGKPDDPGDQRLGVLGHQDILRRHQKSKLRSSCRICHRVRTPKWRLGPDGPRTLCNVCGLIFAKRELRRQESIANISTPRCPP